MPNPAYDVLQLTAMLSVRQGNDGYSPSITVKEDTDTSYVLTIENENGSFDTPNLISEQLVEKVNNKVDKVEGKELSTNDFTDEHKEKLESLQNYDDSSVKNSINLLKTQVGNLHNYDDTEVKGSINLLKTQVDGLHNYDDSAIVASVDEISIRVNELDSSLTQTNNNVNEINERISKLGAVTVVDVLPGQDIRSDIIYAVKHENIIGYTSAYGTIIPELNEYNMDEQLNYLYNAIQNNGWTEEELMSLNCLQYAMIPMNLRTYHDFFDRNYYDNDNKLYTISFDKLFYTKTFTNIDEMYNFIFSEEYVNIFDFGGDESVRNDFINDRNILKAKGFKYSNEALSDNEFGVVYLPEINYDYYIYDGKDFISINDDIIVKELHCDQTYSLFDKLKTLSFTTEEFDKIFNGSKLLIRVISLIDNQTIESQCIVNTYEKTKLPSAEAMDNIIEFKYNASVLNNNTSYIVIVSNIANEITVEVAQDSMVINSRVYPHGIDWIQIDNNTTSSIHKTFKTMGYNYFMQNIDMPGITLSNYGAALVIPRADSIYTMQQILTGNICPYCAIFNGVGYIFAKERPTGEISLHCIFIQ